jgi:hypothetical protein
MEKITYLWRGSEQNKSPILLTQQLKYNIWYDKQKKNFNVYA